MRMPSTYRPLWLIIGVYLVMFIPPVRTLSEATMSGHMLLQLPFLAVIGWGIGKRLPQTLVAHADQWNYRGITGLIVVTITSSVWMLPTMLDRAAASATVDIAKFITIPLLVGLPIAISWPRMGFVLRGVFISEFIAMFFRLGWVYLISPTRLCNNYLFDDQQLSGKVMLVLGIVLVLVVAYKMIWGKFDTLNGGAHVGEV